MGKIVTVDFRNDTLFAVERDDGVFVAVKPICDSLGLAWGSQHNRLLRDTILAEGVFTMKMPSVGGVQETTCLRLDLVNGWLLTIDESRVKEECRDLVLTYKRECYSVLFQHFYGKQGRPGHEDEGELLAAETAKVRIVNEARHVFGAQAAAQLWVKLGLPIAPAMMHDPRQLTFINLDTVKTEQGAA